MAIYYMRRNRKTGDIVFKVLYCPFCGTPLKQVPVDASAKEKATREAAALAEI